MNYKDCSTETLLDVIKRNQYGMFKACEYSDMPEEEFTKLSEEVKLAEREILSRVDR